MLGGAFACLDDAASKQGSPIPSGRISSRVQHWGFWAGKQVAPPRAQVKTKRVNPVPIPDLSISTYRKLIAASPPLHEAQEWQGRIYLPPRGPRRELFYARLAGPTDVYPFGAADTLTIRPRPGDDVLGCLVESGFAGREWRVRAEAVHARSRTYRL